MWAHFLAHETFRRRVLSDYFHTSARVEKERTSIGFESVWRVSGSASALPRGEEYRKDLKQLEIQFLFCCAPENLVQRGNFQYIYTIKP